MIQILLSGCNGRMGRTVTALVAESADAKIAAGVDLNNALPNTYPVVAAPREFKGRADVVVDFSHVSALPALLDYCVLTNTPLVLATTGQDEDMKRQIERAAERIPVFRSANMSLGINLLIDLVKKAARVLGSSFDIEIIEKHHNQKLDAPSGTALMLADAVASVMPEKAEYVYDRHAVRKKRDSNEIGLHAVRGGSIVGDHDVLFAGYNETVTLSHQSMSRDIFAAGALRAAGFLVKVGKPGLYNMEDLVASL